MSNKLYRKIVVLDSVIFFPEHRTRLNALSDEVIEYNTCTTEDEVSERCRGADCIITCWVDISHRIIDENPQLRTIAFWTHDFEHRIDAKYARERGIHIPAIPDYGTDSVAELVFIALLNLPVQEQGTAAEQVAARIGDDVRCFNRNVKDTLDGRWLHEYVKTGQRQLKSAAEIPEETLKGLTVGFLDNSILDPELIRILADGLGMNVIYSLSDRPNCLGAGFRPVDQLLVESQIVVFNGCKLEAAFRHMVENRPYLSKVDTSDLTAGSGRLQGRKLGIIGLGRIGGRVAQIARDGFGMAVQYASRTRKPDLERTLGLTWGSVEETVSWADIVSFHLPHHGTENFVTPELLAKIPPSKIVLNASVGNILADETQFLSRFVAGDLRGYIDVYKTLPPRMMLRDLRGALTATYRLGWRTKSTVGLKTHRLLSKIEAAGSAGRSDS